MQERATDLAAPKSDLDPRWNWGRQLPSWGTNGVDFESPGPRDPVASAPISTRAFAETLAEFSAAVPWQIVRQQFLLLGSHDTARIRTVLAGDRARLRLAFGLLNIAWLTLLLVVWPRWRDTALDRGVRFLLVLEVLTALAWIVIQFDPRSTVNTHASYAMVIIAMLVAVVLLARTSAALVRAVCFANVKGPEFFKNIDKASNCLKFKP